MGFGDEEILHLERLSKIRLDPESRTRLKGDLSRIIEFVKVIQKSELSAAGEEGPEIGGGTKLRSDEPAHSLDPDEILGEAPDRFEDYFIVPPVLSDNSET